MTHTKDPWRVGACRKAIFVGSNIEGYDESKYHRGIAKKIVRSDFGKWAISAEHSANLDRIVVDHNALAGIADPEAWVKAAEGGE